MPDKNKKIDETSINKNYIETNFKTQDCKQYQSIYKRATDKNAALIFTEHK